MKGKWIVLHNPMAGYIVARMRDTRQVMHSGNLEYHGEYSDDKEECQRVADELNRTGGNGNEQSLSQQS